MTANPDGTAVVANGYWPTNGHLIADAAKLGYLRGTVLDPTYGEGVWWNTWRPRRLIAHDIQLDAVDFCALPYKAHRFGTIAYDPPYKLNGTPDPIVDAPYGVDIPARWQDRMALCIEGATECVRVLAPGGHLLWKCQNQVCSGRVRWQVDVFTQHAESLGLVKVTQFNKIGGRPQPKRKGQVHPENNYSTLLVLRKPLPKKRRIKKIARH